MRLGAMEASDQLTARMGGPEPDEDLHAAREHAETPDAVEDLNSTAGIRSIGLSSTPDGVARAQKVPAGLTNAQIASARKTMAISRCAHRQCDRTCHCPALTSSSRRSASGCWSR